MKHFIFSFLYCLILFSSAHSQAQKSTSSYKKIDYLKVEPENIDSFLSMMNNHFNSDIKTGDDSDIIQSWSLYKVQYPGGERSGYNFVIITTASSMKVFQEHYSAVDAPVFVPEEFNAQDKKQFENLCSLVKSEVWKVENELPYDDSASDPSRYMTMDYMNVAPGKRFDYLMLEDEIAKPIHTERIKKDRMQSWQVYSLILPGGINYGYNFATGNFFSELGHIEFGFTNEIINQAMGGDNNIPELFHTIYTTRDLVKTEMWELVSHGK